MQKKFIPFIPDALALKLTHPVAVIARKTGDDPSNVSAFLRGVKRPGNAFLVRFYTAFDSQLSAVGIRREISTFIAITPRKRKTTKETFWRTLARRLDKRNALLRKLEKEVARQGEEQKKIRKELQHIKILIEDRNNRLVNRQRPFYN